MVEPQPDPETQVGVLAEVLAAHGVRYVVFGSLAGRLHGAELRTLDIDIVPAASVDNLARLADALNSLRPRWRTAETGEGMKIDGWLEARHFAGDTFAIGLVTRLGYVDVVLHPKGFEAGYDALIPRAVVMRVGDSDIVVGDLDDLIRPNEQLNREKDRLHLPSLRQRAAEIRHESLANRPPTERDLGPAPSECERQPSSVVAPWQCKLSSVPRPASRSHHRQVGSVLADGKRALRTHSPSAVEPAIPDAPAGDARRRSWDSRA